MYQLDEKFLDDIGLSGLPEEQRRPFLQHIYEQLEYQVGISLSDGLSDDQLDEFEAIIDHNPEVVTAWLYAKLPEFRTNEDYLKIKANIEQQATQAGQEIPGEQAAMAEFAAAKWLEVNRPDYRDVVARTLEEIKQEVISNRDAILGK